MTSEDMTTEVIQEAAMNVYRRLYGPAVGIDVAAAECLFRSMVDEVGKIGRASEDARVQLMKITEG